MSRAIKRGFEFQTQLARGRGGEGFLVRQHDPQLLLAEPGTRTHDLEQCQPFGGPRLTVEVKTDSYPMDTTPNFVMERYTTPYGKERLEGGPWRAHQHAVDVFVYLFSNANDLAHYPEGKYEALLPPTAFWFWNVPELVRATEAVLAALRGRGVKYIRRIPNIGCYATVALVPRDALLAEYNGAVERVEY